MISDLIFEPMISDDQLLPRKAGPFEMGYDIYAYEDVIFPSVWDINEGVFVKFGIKSVIPHDMGAIIKDRSSMAKRFIFHLGGVFDSTYRGEWAVTFINFGVEYLIKKNEKICQFILLENINLDVTKGDVSKFPSYRGNKGFGSFSGK